MDMNLEATQMIGSRLGNRSQESGLKKTVDRRKGDSPLVIVLFTLANLAVLAAAFVHRDDPVLNAKTGAGYWIGIAGALLMLSLVLYPMRKRMKAMRTWGDPAEWFRWHMMLGIVGPVLIVAHSNFRVASANASVAFFSMLIVAASGVAGRYLYGRIHRGLYGQKLEARALRDDIAFERRLFSTSDRGDDALGQALETFEKATLTPPEGLGQALWRAASIGFETAACARAIQPELLANMESEARVAGLGSDEIRRKKREIRKIISSYFRSIRAAARLNLYERLFSLWHVLHVPLFIILVVTAIVHVVAVHLY
jgi:hypothetical protein